jgi:hypothetical protein
MKIALPVIVVFGMGLIALLLSGEIAAKADQDLIVSVIDKDLPYRISKLEPKLQLWSCESKSWNPSPE